MYKIYAIFCKPSEKIYIGQTRQEYHRRWQLHKSRAAKKYNHHFPNAINLYGEDAFLHIILAEVPKREEADELEIEWISRFKASNPQFGYNMTYGGDGVRPTPESIEKHRRKMTGRKNSAEHRRKCSEGLKKAWAEGRHSGNHKSPSLENRRKQSARMTGINHPNYFRHVDVEQLIAWRRLGLTTREVAAKAGVSRDTVERRFKKLGLKFPPVTARSEETKRKIGSFHRGRKRSDAFKNKVRESLSAWWAKRKESLACGDIGSSSFGPVKTDSIGASTA